MDLTTLGRALRAGLMVAVLWAAAAVMITETATAQISATTSYFPSSSTTDGRMLAIIGSAMQSFDGSEMIFTITVDPKANSAHSNLAGFKLEVFDGDDDGMWDYGTSGELEYTLYGDPEGDGSGTHSFSSTTGTAMANNAWSNLFEYWFDPAATSNATTIEHNTYALNTTSKLYRYKLKIKAATTASGQYWNGFKLRIEGFASMTTRQFQFATIITDNDDALVVYPNDYLGTGGWTNTSTIASFTPDSTTYDGTWKFYMDVPDIDYVTDGVDTTWVEIWDGDFDFGQYDRSAVDGDDGNSSTPPSHATSGAVTEGVPTTGDKARTSAGVPFLDGTRSTGNPSDDNHLAVYRRTPFLYPDDDGTTTPKGLRYWLTDPLGTHYFNSNPSGNLEWERYRVGLIGTTASDGVAYDVDAFNGLPLGVWSVEIDGADVLNFNALNTSHAFCGQDAAGNSVCPTDITCGNLKCLIAPGSTAEHTMIIGRAGVYTWGKNNRAQLGIDNNQDQMNPVRVLAGAASGTYLGEGCNPAVMGAVGAEASIVMMRDGTLYSWGDNGKGQLGDGTNSWRRTPVKVLAGAAAPSTGGPYYLGSYDGPDAGTDPDDPVQAVSMGKEHSAALMESGLVYAWGSNWKGEVGDSTLTQRNAPVAVRKGAYASTGTQLGSNPDNPIVQISMGDGYSLALDRNGIVYAWGYNNFGQLGDSTITDRREPVKVRAGAYGTANTVNDTASYFLGEAPNNPVIMISAGGGHAIALTADGRVWSWGGNMQGQLGDGTTTERRTPVKVLPGQYDANGYNGEGQLGDSALNRIVFISAGGTGGTSNQGHNLVQDANGMVYSWGDNRLGELGINTSGSGTDRTSPVKVLSGASNPSAPTTTYLGDSELFTVVTAHKTHTVALVGDCQTVYAFGQGNNGRIGDGDDVDRPIAVEVDWGTLTPTMRFIAPPVPHSEWTATGAQFESALANTESRSHGSIQKGSIGTGSHTLLTGVSVDVAGSRLNIDVIASAAGDATIEVYSVGGERVDITPSVVSLDAGARRVVLALPASMAEGMYLLRLSHNGNTSMERFVLTR